MAALSVGLSARSCEIASSRWEFRDRDQVVAGRLLYVDPASVPAFRGSGDLPGRHRTLTVDGLRVDVWRTGGPAPRYRAYWTTPDGTPHAVHSENMDGDLRLLTEEVRSTLRLVSVPSGASPAPPPTVLPVPGDGTRPPPMRYVRTTLRPAGGAPVELPVTSDLIGYGAPVGARRVPELSTPNGLEAWWWEEGGVVHLDWTVDGPGFMSSRSLQGKGLTLDGALALARSLQQVPLGDPRLRVGRSGETVPTAGNSR